MRTICKIFGYLLWIGAGILMFIFWATAMSKWLGFLGTILAIILNPGLVIFPLVFWIVEGVFPTFYFMVWGIGIVGLIIARISSKDE
ncbi:MAG: hypothetical protein LDL38_07775 [Flavobacterium piscis]|nr:hypothetical protein [Flavobacterium piscis]